MLESFVLEFNSVKTPYLGVTFTYFASAFFFPERVINRKTASYDSLKETRRPGHDFCNK